MTNVLLRTNILHRCRQSQVWDELVRSGVCVQVEELPHVIPYVASYYVSQGGKLKLHIGYSVGF